MGEKDAPVLHVLVIGFHHKRGCQVSKCVLFASAILSIDNFM